ncbi:hypothetical protein BDF19DRAFT_452081 [Syncephalis fuscata]|nr:hypothetical protein BDF19DRAFT_452081 [Syncephalis fuscata]
MALFLNSLRGIRSNKASSIPQLRPRLATSILGPKTLCREIRTSVNQVRRGQVLDFRSKIWLVTKRDHGKTGRGGAVIKIEMKDPINGGRQTERFNPGDTVEESGLLLNSETYEELEMDLNAIDGSEKHLDLLEDGMIISVQILETDQPILYRLPKTHIYTIDRDEPAAGQASKGVSYKTAYVAGGKVRLSVPEFIKVGDRVVVDLENIEYVSRDSKA